MESLFSTSSIVVAAKEQIHCNLAEEAVVLGLRAGVYYGLNSVAARIWNLVQEPKTVQELRDVIVAEYDVDPDRCERDLLGLLRDLATRDLIEAKRGASS